MSATAADALRRPLSVGIIASAPTIRAVHRALDCDDRISVIAAAREVGALHALRRRPRVAVLADAAPMTLLAQARTLLAAGLGIVVLVGDRQDLDVVAMERAGVRVTHAVEDIAAAVVEAVEPRRAPAEEPAGERRVRPRLSTRERLALTYYAQGMSTIQVARELGVGYETAKTFLRRVRQKYASVDRPASRRADLAARASEDGIL